MMMITWIRLHYEHLTRHQHHQWCHHHLTSKEVEKRGKMHLLIQHDYDRDMDSVASEALDEYESHHIHRNEEERRRSGASQFNFPFAAGGNDSPPFGSDHHPFSYFTNNHRASYHDEDDDDNTPGLSIRGVLNFGKNWLGGGDSP